MAVHMLYSLGSFISKNADKICFSNGALQVATNVYSSKNPQNFERIQKIQWIFTYINIGALFVSISQIFSAIPILPIYTSQNTLIFGALALGGYYSLIKGLDVVQKTTNYINEKSTPTNDIQDWLAIGRDSTTPAQANDNPDVNAEWHHPQMKQFNQNIYILQLITSVALMVISKSPYFYAISAISYGYSLYKKSSQAWVKLAYRIWHLREYSAARVVLNLRPRERAFHYDYYIFPVVLNKDEQATCDKCHKRNPTTAFHGTHLFHPSCLFEDLKEKKTPSK